MNPSSQDPGNHVNPSGFNSHNCVDLVIDGVGVPTSTPTPPAVLEFLRQQRAKLARYREMMKEQPPEGGQPSSDTGKSG